MEKCLQNAIRKTIGLYDMVAAAALLYVCQHRTSVKHQERGNEKG